MTITHPKPITFSLIKRLWFWMTVLNLGLYIYSVIVVIFMEDWSYRLQTEIFGFNISREMFNTVLYIFLGLYKLLILFFCVIPYLAMRLVRSSDYAH